MHHPQAGRPPGAGRSTGPRADVALPFGYREVAGSARAGLLHQIDARDEKSRAGRECGASISYAHRLNPTGKDIAVGTFAVANNISRRLLPPVYLGKLPGDPFGVRMRSDSQAQKLAICLVQSAPESRHKQSTRPIRG